jgi:hypothetical protein
LALACGLAGFAAPAAAADPTPGPCTMTMSVTPSSGTSFTVSGVVTGAGAGATVTISGGGATVTAGTNSSGAYSATLSPANPGSQNISATASGGYCTTVTTPPGVNVTVTAPATLAIDPDSSTTIKGGEAISITGTLKSGSNGISGALITITPNWSGASASTWVTDGDGKFEALFIGPNTAEGNPQVVVAFAGDGLYPATSQTVAIRVTEPAPTQAATTPGANASATPGVTPTASPGATPTARATGTAGAADVIPPWEKGSRLFVIVIIFAVVGALAIITLIVIAVLSRMKRGLAEDERRGFGTDFGQTKPQRAAEEEADAPEDTGPVQAISDEDETAG